MVAGGALDPVGTDPTDVDGWTVDVTSLGMVSELVAVGLSPDEHAAAHATTDSANPTTTTRLDTSPRLGAATLDRMAHHPLLAIDA
jgi:hypothetical protein